MNTFAIYFHISVMSHTVLYGSRGSLPLWERSHVIDIIGFLGNIRYYL